MLTHSVTVAGVTISYPSELSKEVESLPLIIVIKLSVHF